MKKGLLIFLIAVSPAWAEDQKNVYDVFGKWLQPSAAATADEQVTALIKRHMANLLYPVDVGSFARPEQDAKFRDLIMVLQEQMGAPATGNLTWDQFDRLAQAARDIDDRPIGATPKTVGMAKDGSWVSASGTVAGDDIAHEIHHTRIMCLRNEKTCNMRSASFDPETSFIWLDLPPIPYTVKVWKSDTVVAVSEDACGIETMTINPVAETVTFASTGTCLNRTQRTYNLVDGWTVTWKIHHEKMNKARALVYEPARRLVPPVQDVSPVQR